MSSFTDDLPIEHTPKHHPQVAREVVNGATHGVGAVLSVVALAWLVHVALRQGGPWELAGSSIFGLSMVLVYAASTLSHLCRVPRWRRVFRKADQACIHLLIAGTYTALALTYLRGGDWWILSAVVWAVALAGFVSKAVLAHRVDRVSVPIYVVAAYLPTVAIRQLIGAMPEPLVYWMIAGGILYTLGLPFLYRDSRVPYSHAIWHLLVMAGSACHYFGILMYCATRTA